MKIRVLQFPFSQRNGVTIYATNNWKYLNKDKFQCDFAVVRNTFDPQWESALIQSGSDIKTLFYSADRERERYIEGLRKILYGKYDVVHLHTSFWKRLLVEQIAVECNIPKIIVHSHSSGIDICNNTARLAAEKIHYELREQFNTSLATNFCAGSGVAADWLFGPQIPNSRIQFLKYPIVVERFLFDEDVRNKYRRDFGLDGCFVVGTVGRFSYQKNQEFLLKVFKSVCEQVYNTRLLLVGDGPLENDLRELAQQLGIYEKTLFLTNRGDIPQLLQAMDVFCLPSRFEGLPISLIEAQTAGLQCLASNQVTDEAGIGEYLHRLPLDSKVWMNVLMDLASGYDRENLFDLVTESGYNIQFQIHELEKLYTD